MSSATISTLSDDILYHIFTFLADFSKASFVDILSVSHVCRRWRGIAIDTPELWRRFVFLEWQAFPDPKVSLQILERCRNCPIDVGWYDGLEEKEEPRTVDLGRRLLHLDKMRSLVLLL
ncbi:hypothetical protein CC2G_004497 [Coprinopsis cinerea AmutBmut pab1-1]|nr:hypothetical protein CC2G_004497 [Coprinopsis cinerea AmutBmut pab1-1]